MKNLFKLFLFLFATLTFYTTNAIDIEKEDGVLTKEIFTTTDKVNKDFWEEYTKALDKYFINIRYYKDSKSIENLNNAISPLMKKYSEKKTLNKEEEKVYNLIKNIYLRWVLVEKYIK